MSETEEETRRKMEEMKLRGEEYKDDDDRTRKDRDDEDYEAKK